MAKSNSNRSYLQKGQSIGIIALSSPCQRERFLAGVKTLEGYGYRAKVALDPCRHYGSSKHLFSSDSAGARARALERLIADKEVGAIIAARGAYGSMEVLPLLNYKEIRKNPKPLIGFSDATAVLIALDHLAGTPVMHGPSIESAFSKADSDTDARRSADTLIEILQGGATETLRDIKLSAICGSSSEKVRGKIAGGNLSILSALMGTKWQAQLRDRILFIEEKGERPYRIHRMLLQMKLAGAFKGLRGVVLGSFSECESSSGKGPELREVFADIFEELRIPVRGYLPSGHSRLNLTVPFRAAKLSKDKLEFD